MAFWDEVNKGVGQVSDILKQGADVYDKIMGKAGTTQTTVPVETTAGGAEVTADDVRPQDNTALIVVGAVVLLVLLSR